MDLDIKVAFVQCSNTLDGVKLSMDTSLALARGDFTGDEVAGIDGVMYPVEVVTDHIFALDLVEEMTEERIFPKDLVQQLHIALMRKILLSAGEYREFDLRGGGVPSKLVPAWIDKFCEYLNSKFYRAVRPESFAWTMHHELARIRPFVQGNGRVCRLVYALLRMKAGLKLDIGVFADREAYLRRINDYLRKKSQKA